MVDVDVGGRTHIGWPAPYGKWATYYMYSRPIKRAAVRIEETAGVAGLTTRPPTTHFIFNIYCLVRICMGWRGWWPATLILYFFFVFIVIKTNWPFLNLPFFDRRSAFNGSTNSPGIWPGWSESGGRVSAKLLPP